MNKIVIVLLFLLITTQIYTQENEGFNKFKQEEFGTKLKMLNGVLFGGMDQRGLSFRSGFKNNYTRKKKLNKKILATIENDSCISFNSAYYPQDYANSTNSTITYSTNVAILESGMDTFEKRLKLIDDATKSIYICTWAIYDDETGLLLQNKLLEKVTQNPQIDIRIIADGQLSIRKEHNKVLKTLEEKSNGKIKIIRWKTRPYRANGNHRKIMITDKNICILGGMNFGNLYSHIVGDDFWVDTDILIEGEPALEAHNLFINIWNEQVKNNKEAKHLGKIENSSFKVEKNQQIKNLIPVVIIDHNPGTKDAKADQNITTGILKLMYDAKYTIAIENAYFIMTPLLKNAIKQAIHRGVKIRLLTNSEASLNEVIISNPIVSSAIEAAKLGVEVYLKKGATLHSKYLIVDENISMVGSFNLQPRSYHYEGETVAVIFDENIGKILLNQFNINISPTKAQKLTNTNLEPKDNFMAKFARTLFFNHL